MTRVPDTVIERLKQEVSVQRLAEKRGITLKRHGADLLGLCPFHDDLEPSLVISPRKNLWHLLGRSGVRSCNHAKVLPRIFSSASTRPGAIAC